MPNCHDRHNHHKKDSDPNFNVTMGSYDGAEICQLVGLYILHVLREKYGKDKIGLYRDDGLVWTLCVHPYRICIGASAHLYGEEQSY